MFKIGDFSRICRVPVSALRYYADIGLLQPAQIDSFTGFRYYSLDQLPRLNRILALKDLGLSLTQIQQILNEDLSASEIRGMLKLKEAELEQELEERQSTLARVKARLELIEHEQQMMTLPEIVLKSVEKQVAFTIREVIPTPKHVEYLMIETYPVLYANGIEITGQPYVIYHDNAFKAADIDIEMVYPIGKRVNQAFDLERGRKLADKEVPAIETAASILHIGSYDRLEETYRIMGQWVETNGYQLAGLIREIYLRAPGENEEAITEIQFPVMK